MKKYLYLDIDGVLAVGYTSKTKETPWGNIYKWDAKCVKILNDIIKETGADIIVSSDWKNSFMFYELVEIFKWQGVEKSPISITPHIAGGSLQQLDEFRAKEILMHVEEHKPDKWVAIDDLVLHPYIDEEHFVEMPRWMEGVKQSGKKDKITMLLS